MNRETSSKDCDLVVSLLADEILKRQKLSFLIYRQFLLGIVYGLGASLGAAIIGGALIYIYRNILGGFVNRP